MLELKVVAAPDNSQFMKIILVNTESWKILKKSYFCVTIADILVQKFLIKNVYISWAGKNFQNAIKLTSLLSYHFIWLRLTKSRDKCITWIVFNFQQNCTCHALKVLRFAGTSFSQIVGFLKTSMFLRVIQPQLSFLKSYQELELRRC